jgi:hypothetical protein
MQDDPDSGPDQQQQAGRCLNEEAGQPLLDGIPIAGEILCTAQDPDETQHRRSAIAQIDGAKPQRHEEGRHPFERVHVNAEDALEIGVAGGCREFHAVLDARYGDPGRQKDIEQHGKQSNDWRVIRHDDLCGASSNG